MRKQRCPSVYPGAVTLNGRPVRCELSAGHDGRHGHSFAARYWDDYDKVQLAEPDDDYVCYFPLAPQPSIVERQPG